MDSALIFNDVNSVPDTENVTSTLEEAVTSNNSAIAGLAVNSTSIKAERKT